MPTITQAELLHLVVAREEAHAASVRAHDLRDAILYKYDHGHTVQPGAFELAVNPTKSLRLTKATVAAVIGEAKLTWLLERLTPTWTRNLVVKRVK